MRGKKHSISVLKDAVLTSFDRGFKVNLFGELHYALNERQSVVIYGHRYQADQAGIYRFAATSNGSDRMFSKVSDLPDFELYLERITADKSAFEVEMAMVGVFGRLTIKRLLEKQSSPEVSR